MAAQQRRDPVEVAQFLEQLIQAALRVLASLEPKLQQMALVDLMARLEPSLQELAQLEPEQAALVQQLVAEVQARFAPARH